MPSAVYSITHRDSGREYIGFTSRDVRARWGAHVSTAGKLRTHLSKALATYGTHAFDFKVEAMLPTSDEAKIAEMLLIATARPDFNHSRGGDGALGAKHPPRSAQWHARMSAARKGQRIWGGHREMLAAQKASADMRRGKPNPEHAAKMSGRKASAETRAKMSASHRARHAAKVSTQ